VISTGDGGMITTRDAARDARLRMLREHGMSVPANVRHGSGKVIFESYSEVGWNYRMTDIQAAIGRVQLGRLPGIVEDRRIQGDRYGKLLADIPGLALPLEPAWARTNWQSYCVRLPAECDQRNVMQRLLDAGVSSRRGIMCSHREPAYADLPLPHPLRESERAQDGCILLPLFPGLSAADQDKVADTLREACRVR